MKTNQKMHSSSGQKQVDGKKREEEIIISHPFDKKLKKDEWEDDPRQNELQFSPKLIDTEWP